MRVVVEGEVKELVIKDWRGNDCAWEVISDHHDVIVDYITLSRIEYDRWQAYSDREKDLVTLKKSIESKLNKETRMMFLHEVIMAGKCVSLFDAQQKEIDIVNNWAEKMEHRDCKCDTPLIYSALSTKCLRCKGKC